jgi:hypothetical protein
MALQLRRGTNAQRLGLTPVEGEMIYITDSVLVSISVTGINAGTDTLTTSVEHGLSLNQQIKFIGTTLNGLTKDQVYFVLTTPSTTTFTLSTTLGGGTLNITGTYSVPLVFAITPCNASGAPIGYTESALWAGDGTTVGGLAVGITNIDALNDVDITEPAEEGEFLWYNGTNWINENETTVDTKEKTLSLTRRYTSAAKEYESAIAQRLNGRVTNVTNDNTDDAGPALRFERSSGTQYTKTYVSGGAIGAFTVTLNNVTNLVVGNKVTGTGLPQGNGALITIIAGNQLTLDTAFTVQASGTYTIGAPVGFGQLAFEYYGTTDVHAFKVTTSTDDYFENPADTYPGTYTLINSTKNSTNINQGRLFIDDVNDRVGVNTTSPTTGLEINGGLLQYTGTSAARPVFRYDNSDAGPSSVLNVRKNYGASTYTAGDGAGITIQIDSDSQALNQIAIIDAFYDNTASPNKNSSIRLRTNTLDGTAGPYTEVAKFTPVLATLAGALEIDGNIIRNSTGNDTITMATGSTGLVTLSGDLQVTGNEIKNNLGTSVITFDINSEVEFADAIQIKGNNIRNSTGNDTITMGTGANGTVTLSGPLQCASSEDVADGAAISLTIAASYFSTGASGETATLAAGNNGQFKSLMMVADGGGDMVVTVTNAGWKTSGTGTITFDTIGESCLLQYINSKWFAVGTNGVAFA